MLSFCAASRWKRDGKSGEGTVRSHRTGGLRGAQLTFRGQSIPASRWSPWRPGGSLETEPLSSAHTPPSHLQVHSTRSAVPRALRNRPLSRTQRARCLWTSFWPDSTAPSVRCARELGCWADATAMPTLGPRDSEVTVRVTVQGTATLLSVTSKGPWYSVQIGTFLLRLKYTLHYDSDSLKYPPEQNVRAEVH